MVSSSYLLCHLITYCKETSLTNFSDLDPDSQMFIALHAVKYGYYEP